MVLLTVLLYIVALVVFLFLLSRARGVMRFAGWLVGLACLIGFLYLVSTHH